MIRFFRNIRQKLITESRLSKYLFYALGEIALVMIGILLALQVNNWNERRKEKAAESILLYNLLDEFENNLNSLNNISAHKKDLKIKWDDYLEKISKPKSPLPDKILERPNNGSQEYNNTSSVVNSMLSSGKLDIISNDSLKYYISNWENSINDYREIERRHVDFVEGHLRTYEIKHLISLDYSGPTFQLPNPFYNNYTSEQLTTRMLNVNNDPEYQYILQLNRMWIHLIVERSQLLETRINKIINLLETEIQEQQQ